MDKETTMVIPELELAKAINNLADAINNHKMPTTVSGKALEKAVESAAIKAVSRDKETNTEIPSVQGKEEPEQKEAKTEQVSMALSQENEEITLDELRALGAKLKAHGLATKEVINGMGYEKLSSVPQELFAELKKKFEILLGNDNGTA